MAYKKHEWKARQGTGLNKFRDQDGKLYEFTSAPDSVSQPGTPFSADWMNEMEDGIAAAGITYLTSPAASGASSITITDNAPDTVAAGDHFRIYFPNQAGAGAKLNIGNTGAHPIINNYSGTPVAQGDIPADYVADIMFDGSDYILLNPLVVSGTPTGYAFFTSDGSFTVPNFVTAVKISACAAGAGRYAGEYIVDQIYNVTPGQMIEITVGAGNTVIGDLATLVAGSVASALATTKLGYAAGYNGGNGSTSDGGGYGGYGGAFGYGGGAGGGSGSGVAGGGGAGIGGAGTSGNYNLAGKGGGATGGAGGGSSVECEDAKSGKLIYIGAIDNGKKGGDGSIHGAGGGAGGVSNVSRGGGGAAGGYGAGGGESGRVSVSQASTIYGQPSSGMVLIEWGGISGASEQLPSGYTPLTYIEASGTQYIKTGYNPNHNTRIVAQAQCRVRDSVNAVYGARRSSTTDAFMFVGGSGAHYVCRYGSDVLNFDKDIDIDTFFTIDQNKHHITIDGKYSLTASQQEFSVPCDIVIFGINTNGNVSSASNVKIKYLKIYDDLRLVHAYFPCIDPNGEYGMYDYVDRVFCGNSGTGVFTGA